MMVKVQSLAKGKEFCQSINLHIYMKHAGVEIRMAEKWMMIGKLVLLKYDYHKTILKIID